jgi:hypothetical protein
VRVMGEVERREYGNMGIVRLLRASLSSYQ